MAKDIYLQGSRNKRVNASKEVRRQKAVNKYAKSTASKMGGVSKKSKSYKEPMKYTIPSRSVKRAKAPRKKY